MIDQATAVLKRIAFAALNVTSASGIVTHSRRSNVAGHVRCSGLVRRHLSGSWFGRRQARRHYCDGGFAELKEEALRCGLKVLLGRWKEGSVMENSCDVKGDAWFSE